MIKVKSWKIADKLFPYAVFILFLLSFLFSPYETFFLYVLSLGVIFNLYKKINYFYFLAILGISVFFIININLNYFYSWLWCKWQGFTTACTIFSKTLQKLSFCCT